MVKVDGVTVPTMPFMLLKKDKPRVLRFELAGYKPVEKTVDPGAHYVIGIGVDFASHKALLMEFDQPPGSTDAVPGAEAIPAAAPRIGRDYHRFRDYRAGQVRPLRPDPHLPARRQILSVLNLG
jgi:hypothetical protein